MATARGRSEVSAYMQGLPKRLKKVLRGAARAGGLVIAEDAKQRSVSDEVAAAVIVRPKADDYRASVRVTVRRGFLYSRALWQEYGTAPHFISVAEEQRQGLGLRRINTKVREAKGDGSLVIGGKFVGATVFHPGARAHPFLRPALDIKGGDAVRAAQSYIDANASRADLGTGVESDGT